MPGYRPVGVVRSHVRACSGIRGMTPPIRSVEGSGGLEPAAALSAAEAPIFTDSTSDYLIVALLATGLAEIEAEAQRRQLDHGMTGKRRLSGPKLLPAPWRAAVARLWWKFQRAGVSAPVDDLALFELCRVPFVDWDIKLELSEMDRETCLLDGDELTELAREAAKLGVHDVEADFVEVLTFQTLKAVAEKNGDTDEQLQHNYERLRRFLIDNTVISDKRVRALMREFPAPGANGQPYVSTLIETAYQRRAAGATVVRIDCCDGCKNPLVENSRTCGTPGCLGNPEVLELAVFDAYFVQHRGVRRYIHDAGLLEVRLHDTLAADLIGEPVFLQAWPNRDAFDLLVAFLNPTDPDPARPVEVWGVDGKDHASPRLLAIGFRWKFDPHCDRRFIVLPMHRAAQPGYIRDLETELEGRDSGVEIVDEQTFLQMVNDRVRGSQR